MDVDEKCIELATAFLAGRETQNDTVEYWRTRAITAETKLLEFSAQLEKLEPGEKP